jgi:hypothetical protein
MEEFLYRGEIIQANPVNNSQYIIHRIISSSLKPYLDPKLQPGTVVNLKNLTRL